MNPEHYKGPTHINAKIADLNEQAKNAAEQARLRKAEAKLAALIEEQFPGAIHMVQPNGAAGYVDRSINAQTHGVVRRHAYANDPLVNQKKFGYYYELTVKIGKQKMIVTSEIQGWLQTNDVLIILDASCAQKNRKALPMEIEVTPTVRKESLGDTMNRLSPGHSDFGES